MAVFLIFWCAPLEILNETLLLLLLKLKQWKQRQEKRKTSGESQQSSSFPFFIRISPYSARMWKNTEQNNSEYGHFSLEKSFFYNNLKKIICVKSSMCFEYVSKNYICISFVARLIDFLYFGWLQESCSKFLRLYLVFWVTLL